ncbi:MAG: TRAP transporter small permease subunit [Proteobacteria bacterium]|nr:TRAP transporter small permease subunit [Pseudomonadota bacterium]
MRLLDLSIAILDGITQLFGRAVSWLVLYMVLMTFANVVMRYMYGYSNIALIETVLYAFAIVLSSTAGWTLQRNEHVRIDIFYSRRSPRMQALTDLLGTLLLLAPVLWVVWTTGVPYVQRSWRLGETSAEVAGLPYIYLLKTFILVFAVTLGIQALSFALRNIRTLILGHDPDADPLGVAETRA